MDVSGLLAAEAAKKNAITIEKEIPLDIDTGFLMVTDLNPIDEESYKADHEEYLQSTARDGIQALISSLFSLPTQSSGDGPLAQLPPPTTQLPRAKPLPKPKPPTKWERFAAAKGIQKKTREKKVWDEERQEWVNRWGRDGQNREKEDQWITEVPTNADVDHDPRKVARDARKARVAKNERQKLQNAARAQASKNGHETRKEDIERTVAMARVSTASMGKFDKKLEGEKKLRGIKRKFAPAESAVEEEKKASLSLISKLGNEATSSRKQKANGDDIINTRKAIRTASKGNGAAALASSAKGKKTRSR